MSKPNANSDIAQISSHSWLEWPRVAETWRDLHSISPHASFFTSPPWVATWLDLFGPDLRPTLHVLELRGVPRAAWILVRRTQNWHRIPMRRVFLGTAGEDEADGTCVEYR